MKNKLQELLKNNFVFFDGAMGTELQKKGMKTGENPVMLNFTSPDMVGAVIRSYAEAGSDIVSMNTFGVNRYKLEGTGKSVEEVIIQAAKVAKDALKDDFPNTLLALDISPIGQLLEPTGVLSFEDAYEMFAEQVKAGVKAGAQLFAIQTFADLYEMKAAVLAVKENSELPVLACMTFEKSGRTFSGVCVPSMALTLEGLGADAIGVNCSLGANDLAQVIKELSEWTSLPIIAKPNAGLPDPETGLFSLSAEEFAQGMAELAEYGVKIVGGCCGTSPEFIKKLKERFSTLPAPGITRQTPVSAVCSASKAVVINRPRIIGERINPTGKKLFKEALKSGDIDYILRQAIEQVNAGADILDVNVGIPGIDEKAVMVRTVKALQSVTDLPLQIDSTDKDVIEAALRVYNGKAIVNSVSGEDASLDALLPVIKKYGAATVGLTLDKSGIPKSAEGRLKIAQKILEKALSYGIKKEDVYIDCLTLTVSAEQESAMQTIEALRRVKSELGLKTVLGISNISFGLPERELINSSFLQIALANGLDLPIINPNSRAMTGAVLAHNLLNKLDVNAAEFIAAYQTKRDSGDGAETKQSSDLTLEAAVKSGLKKEAALITKQLLTHTPPMTIVNTMLIPALDSVGSEFEAGKSFLPQLIMAASAAQAGFEEIRHFSAQKGSPDCISKGKVVLATVKGDIHDIGKNIVKLLLQNYGFEVVDLGKDVPPSEIAEAARKHDARLVGLSALMTTTLRAMEDTITLLRESGINCKVMVGGAVLTPEYALKIGADFYAKDAKEAVDIANEALGLRNEE
ncbi:MAG: homocysteine S-methyltransferase family protein [Oscillospiraceae bacterium]|nr:homocysteine S-methyltransferase family protein [Oscillospiraceae bacterium]